MNQMFVTNHYRVLETMYAHTLSDGSYCPLGQGEVAERLHLSRVAVNKIFSELKEAGYISMVIRGKWKLSDKAILLIQTTQGL